MMRRSRTIDRVHTAGRLSRLTSLPLACSAPTYRQVRLRIPGLGAPRYASKFARPVIYAGTHRVNRRNQIDEIDQID
jgi:hypothetical protein